MSVLHAYFHRRDQQAFQRAIDASVRALAAHPDGKPSSSLGRSLSSSPHASLSSAYLDVNARDALGRTVLHLACASPHPSAPTYVRLLLAHPHVQPNAVDAESRWTPLHRALYHGNLAAALLLLQRPDVDVYAKDWEGYTAYDVWNSSIEGTKPQRTLGDDDNAEAGLEAEMYVWGSNRNAGLGVGDADDRAFPDLVQLARERDNGKSRSVGERFRPVRVGGVSMARFHTAIVTTDPRANVRVCGFGSNGRLGSGAHTTTYTPTPLAGLPTSSSTSTPLQSYHSSSSSHSLPHPRTEHQTTSRPSNDPHRIVAVAAGQDHTLALTASGDVWSWGSNRNSVLGYAIDDATDPSERKAEKKVAEKHDARKGEKEAGAVQTTPRKVQGGLKGKRVRVVAACRTASAAVTVDGEVLTWGVNSGQLGYDRAAHPVQVLPRIVTKVSVPVIDVTITDTATVLLLATHDTLCLHANASFRLVFPAHAFPAAIAPYRPPQAARNASIRRVVATELPASASAGGRESAMFVALSRGGEVFTWVLGAPDANASERERREVVRPQRVWALRKKFSAVRDVALGADGSIVVCTESGHVFLRSRAPGDADGAGSGATTPAGGAPSVGKAFKFQRVPCLQRVVRVYANSAGAYAALRVDARAEEVRVEGAGLAEEIGAVAPWLACAPGLEAVEEPAASEAPARDREDEDLHDPAILADQRALRVLLGLLSRHAQAKKAGEAALFASDAPRAHGADTLVHVLGGAEPHIPAHRVVLAARSSVLGDVLAGKRSVEARVAEGGVIRLTLAKDKDKTPAPADGRHPPPWARPTRLALSGAHALTALVLLTYLYTDNLLAVWDWRVASAPPLAPLFEGLKARPAAVKAELQALAAALELGEMARALEGAFKREVRGELAGALGRVYGAVCAPPAQGVAGLRDPLRPDVVLRLADREVRCHAAVLRARSPFFRAFFDEEVWTVNRWTGDGCVVVDFGHVRWREVGFVVRYLYGAEEDMFDVLEDVDSVDEFLELMFGVMSAANELLLDRLILICSRVIQRFITIPNACAILSEATYYNALPLVRSVQGYMARNLETLLEGRMLDDLPADLVKQLSAFAREQQTRKAPLSRSGRLLEDAMRKHRAWLESEDFPAPIVRSAAGRPQAVGRRRSAGLSPATSPAMRPLSTSRPAPVPQETADDGVFMMDAVDAIPPLSLSQSAGPKAGPSPSQDQKGAGWKVASAVPKVDMKAIMAEAETTKATTSRTAAPRPPTASDAANWRTPQRKAVALPTDTARPAPGSPWKAIPHVPSLANLASSAGQSPVPTPPMTPQMRATRPRDEAPAAGSSRSQPPTPQRPGMGPVFSPAKPSPSKSPAAPGMRRVSSGAAAAWTLPPVQPVVQASAAPAGMSFVAIQEAQREQADAAPRRDRRSLREIQEEEQARQVEQDFLRWWAAEEERMRGEQVEVPPAAPPPPLPARRAKGKKGASKGGAGGKEGVKREKLARPPDGAKDTPEGASGAPRRRRRPAPGAASAAKADARVDG